MDPDVSRWVAEFLLRSSVPDSLVAKTLIILPLSSADPRLKKTLLLRTLQSQLSNASITETTLEILENISDIDRNDAVPVPDSMCRAYCAVAVECTVKYLAALPDDASGEYFSAVKRIWRGRVADVELRRSELFSDVMEQCREDIEAALSDPRVSERLANLNTRNDAFKEVRAYLKEAWETMGPTFLDKLAAMSNKKDKGLSLRSSDGVPVWTVVAEGCTQDVCDLDTARERSDKEDLVGCSNDPVQADVVEGCSKPVREHGDNGDDDDVGDDGGDGDNDDDNGDNDGDVGHDNVDADGAWVREHGDGGDDVGHHNVDADDACGMDGVILNGGDLGKEQLEERDEASFDLNHKPAIASKVTPLASKKSNLRHKHPTLRKCHKGVKISCSEESDPENSWSKDDPVPSAEFRKARESLKSSSAELRTLVKDPLQDALDISEVARSKLASEDTNHEPPIGNQSGQRDVPNSNTCRSIVPYQPKDANIWKSLSPVHGNNVHLKKKSSAHRSNVELRSHSLMKRNRSAQRYEWDDSIDNMPQEIPSKKKKRKWTPLEEETLRNGIKRFGEGKWSTIRNFYSDIFELRSGVDLKDKWRNMIR